MSKYDALATYLRAQPPGRPELALSLDAIEEILGSDLPEAARQYRPWWANTRSSHHGSKWLAAGWKVERVNLSIGLIVFVRADVASIRAREEPGGYAGLKRFLHTLPSQQEQLALDFSELGMVIGHKLPNTALHDRPWWANTVASPQGSAWVSAGWQVDNVYLSAQLVVFRRRGENPLRMIPRYVKAILDGSPTFGHPRSQTLAKSHVD